MCFGLTKLARLLLVALTLAAATAGAARAGHGHGHGHDDGRLELRFLGQQIIPTGTRFQDTEVGGLSSIAYDKRRHVFYALSDDQTNVRFYTLRNGRLGRRSSRPDPGRDDACAMPPASRSRRSASTPKA